MYRIFNLNTYLDLVPPAPLVHWATIVLQCTLSAAAAAMELVSSQSNSAKRRSSLIVERHAILGRPCPRRLFDGRHLIAV